MENKLTLRQLLQLNILYYNLSIYVKPCNFTKPPLINLVRNEDVITEKQIIEKGGEQYLDWNISRLFGDKSCKMAVVLENPIID